MFNVITCAPAISLLNQMTFHCDLAVFFKLTSESKDFDYVNKNVIYLVSKVKH